MRSHQCRRDDAIGYAPIKSKIQHPPPGKPRAFDYSLCPGSGELDLCLRGVGKIEPEVLGFKCFFSGAEVANTYKTYVWAWKSLKEEM